MRCKAGNPMDPMEELEVGLIALLGRKIWAPQILRYLVKLKQNLSMGENEINNYQNQKLQKIILHAYRTVPFYEELFNQHKIDPNSIRTISDLNSLPVINKDMLREIAFERKISLHFLNKRLIKLYTSGSTGKPFTLYISEGNAKKRIANNYRIFFLHGYHIFYRWAKLFGPNLSVRRGWVNKLGLLRKAAVPYDFSIADQVQFLINYNPEIIEGLPSRLNLIAHYIKREHLAVKKPKAIILNTETLLPEVRKLIEEVLGTRVTNIYDSWEFGQMAWECVKHYGLHINSDSLILQIMKNDREVEVGTPGEIVVTDLDNYAMPLIRYNIMDIGVKSKRNCDCGISFPLLESVTGRSNDFLISPKGDYIPPAIIDQVVKMQEGILEFQIVQNSRDSLAIEIIPLNNYDFESDVLIQQKLKTLYHFRDIVITHPTRIKRTEGGKLRAVICNLYNRGVQTL